MRNNKGSLTVEAAFVLPLFTCAVLVIAFFFRLMYLETSIQRAISDAAKDVASYGYLLNRASAAAEDKKNEVLSNIPLGENIYNIITSYADDLALKAVVSGYMDWEMLETTGVVDGFSGLDFSGSDLHDDNDCVYIKVNYTIKVPLAGGFEGLSVTQCAAAGIFSGDIPTYSGEEENGGGPTVYVTQNGSVYHTSLLCTHLNLSISLVDMSEVPSLRNANGAKYYACEYCVKRRQTLEQVYITTDGDRYHSRINCGALTRHINEVSLDDIDLPLCKRCAERMAAEAEQNKENEGKEEFSEGD